MNTIRNISENEWNSYNTLIKNIKEVKLQEFQFKVNYHMLVTKSSIFPNLLKIKKVDNDRCSFCNQESETIIHVLFLCNIVKEFWVALQNWLRIQASIELELTAKNVLFFKHTKKWIIESHTTFSKVFYIQNKVLCQSYNFRNLSYLLEEKI